MFYINKSSFISSINNQIKTKSVNINSLYGVNPLLRGVSASNIACISSSSSVSNGVDTSGLKSKVCCVLGAQWGDEGKGKLADLLAKDYDVIARFNGGANAGHTIVHDGKKFAFHLLPCGLIHKHTINLIGNGVVLHIPALFQELDELHSQGIDTTGRILVSNRTHLLFDFHQAVDGALEKGRGEGGIGTTKKGIGPAYTSKATRNGLRAGHLFEWESFQQSFRSLAQQHSEMYKNIKIDIEGELKTLKKYRDIMIEKKMIVDGVHLINNAYNSGKRILTEGANAVMLDLDFGTYPYVTSSSTTAGGVCTGLGLSPNKISTTIGVVKAYTTRVGGGPFPTELTDDLAGGKLPRGAPGTEIGAHLQKVGAEVGVTTGRKRRCGWLDVVVLKYSNNINGYSGINITKLDVLDKLSEVKIGVAYKINGKKLDDGVMPSTLEELSKVEVEYETLPGWNTDITKVRSYKDLPTNAKKYLDRIEQLIGIPISWVGVGPARDAMILKQ